VDPLHETMKRIRRVVHKKSIKNYKIIFKSKSPFCLLYMNKKLKNQHKKIIVLTFEYYIIFLIEKNF